MEGQSGLSELSVIQGCLLSGVPLYFSIILDCTFCTCDKEWLHLLCHRHFLLCSINIPTSLMHHRYKFFRHFEFSKYLMSHRAYSIQLCSVVWRKAILRLDLNLKYSRSIVYSLTTHQFIFEFIRCQFPLTTPVENQTELCLLVVELTAVSWMCAHWDCSASGIRIFNTYCTCIDVAVKT